MFHPTMIGKSKFLTKRSFCGLISVFQNHIQANLFIPTKIIYLCIFQLQHKNIQTKFIKMKTSNCPALLYNSYILNAWNSFK